MPGVEEQHQHMQTMAFGCSLVLCWYLEQKWTGVGVTPLAQPTENTSPWQEEQVGLLLVSPCKSVQAKHTFLHSGCRQNVAGITLWWKHDLRVRLLLKLTHTHYVTLWVCNSYHKESPHFTSGIGCWASSMYCRDYYCLASGIRNQWSECRVHDVSTIAPRMLLFRDTNDLIS